MELAELHAVVIALEAAVDRGLQVISAHRQVVSVNKENVADDESALARVIGEGGGPDDGRRLVTDQSLADQAVSGPHPVPGSELERVRAVDDRQVAVYGDAR